MCCIEKKSHNNFNIGKDYKNHVIKHSDFGIKTTSSGALTETQLILLKRSLYKKLKLLSNTKTTKVWVLLSLNWTFTSLGLESRMGKGKGSIVTKFATVKSGQILFIFSGLSLTHSILILKFLQNKISFPLKIIKIKY